MCTSCTWKMKRYETKESNKTRDETQRTKRSDQKKPFLFTDLFFPCFVSFQFDSLLNFVFVVSKIVPAFSSCAVYAYTDVWLLCFIFFFKLTKYDVHVKLVQMIKLMFNDGKSINKVQCPLHFQSIPSFPNRTLPILAYNSFCADWIKYRH